MRKSASAGLPWAPWALLGAGLGEALGLPTLARLWVWERTSSHLLSCFRGRHLSKAAQDSCWSSSSHCEDAGGTSLQQCPHSQRIPWDGPCPVTRRAPKGGIQHRPKGGSRTRNYRVMGAADSASLCLQGFPRKFLDMGGWVTCRPINATPVARQNPSQSW